MLCKSLLLAAAIALFALSAVSQIQVQAVGPISMTVADMDRSIDFYTRVLTFEKISDTELAGTEVEKLYGVFGARVRVVRLKLGDESIELTEFLAPRGRPIPLDSRSNDRWFQHIAIIVTDIDRAYAVLRANKVEHASTGPQRLPQWNRNAAGIQAFYFKDPDGHPLEILRFPEDKGLAKWHKMTDRLFLGIDHTAIVVSDTDVSLKFYRDDLGMKIVGTADNYGIEQEHLNLVKDSHVRITSLRAPSGPGIEFLQYLKPADGRPFPPDSQPNDVIYRHTTLVVGDGRTAVITLTKANTGFISSGVVSFAHSELGYGEGVIVRDPDGHALEFVSSINKDHE